MQKKKRSGISAVPILQQLFFKIFLLTMLLAMAQPAFNTYAQTPLGLSEAIDTGLKNYQGILAKQNYYQASDALAKNARNEYLPNLIASVQHSYGTINGQFGPQAPVGVLGVSSAGPAYGKQSWNAAFGSLYIINTNWEVFTFGRVKSRIQLADAQAQRDSADLAQERFVHQIKISSAYLNLLASQQLVRNAQSNLARAAFVQQNVLARTRTGLNAGVDSSLANAEVSRAKLVIVEMRNNEQQLRNQLAQLLNVAGGDFLLDTTFLNHTPSVFTTVAPLTENPQVKFYEARTAVANRTTTLARRSILPGLTLFGLYQGRGSGFDYNYTPEFPDRYSSRYTDGIKPSRYNYVAGVSLSWNLMSPLKVRQQVASQKYIAEAYQKEYDQITMQLRNQLILADQRIANTMESIREVPLQYQAARNAYNQKNVLYKNGLTNIVDLQQAMYALNRAETDKSIACINVWQALLLKAAASGDFDLFINQAQ